MSLHADSAPPNAEREVASVLGDKERVRQRVVARIGFDHFAVCFNKALVPHYETQLPDLKIPMQIMI